MPGPFMPQYENGGDVRVYKPILVEPTRLTTVLDRPTSPLENRYTLWLTVGDYVRLGIGTGSYDIPPTFEKLGHDRQMQVAKIIALKGPNIVKAAGLTAFVEEHHVPVAGVEARTV